MELEIPEVSISRVTFLDKLTLLVVNMTWNLTVTRYLQGLSSGDELFTTEDTGSEDGFFSSITEEFSETSKLLFASTSPDIRRFWL